MGSGCKRLLIANCPLLIFLGYLLFCLSSLAVAAPKTADPPERPPRAEKTAGWLVRLVLPITAHEE